ncbi:MAG: hypothetical protein KDA41_16920, partial [Planctomycetales bacterium]|nr:hypothetical protein [Planctomycetales bacterium]
MQQALGWLLGLKNVESLEVGRPDLAADWAQGSGRFWVFFAGALLLVISYFFYFKFQTRGSRPLRFFLATCRGLLLLLLLLTLADPFLPLRSTTRSQPLLYVLFDGTESMGIEDEFSDDQRAALKNAVGGAAASAG